MRSSLELGAVRVSGPEADDSNGAGGTYLGGPKHGDFPLVSVQRWDKPAGGG